MDERLKPESPAVAPAAAQEAVGSRVAIEHHTVRCDDQDDVGRVLEERFLAARAIEHRPFGRDARRDVHDDPRSPVRRAGCSAQRRAPDLQVIRRVGD
jgi:hypothetical protein